MIIATAFLLGVVFLIPTLLQIRDAAKEAEFTLRETRQLLVKIQEISGRVEEGVEEGRRAIKKVDRVISVLDESFGKYSSNLVKPLTSVLEFVPLIMGATRIYRKFFKKSK